MFLSQVIVWAVLVISIGWIVRLYVLRHQDHARMTEAAEALKELQVLVDKSAELHEKAANRSKTYYEACLGVQAERDQWKKLYYAEAMMHGNAQQLLLTELTNLRTQYVRATGGKQPRVSSLVDTLTQEYAGTHPTPNPPASYEVPETKTLEPETKQG
jgi:hypothetical protein